MATWRAENSMLTAKGVEILNKLKSGEGSITISRIVAGSESVSESKLYTQTEISGEIREMTLSRRKVLENGCEFTFYITNNNDEISKTYCVKQIGIYVEHSDYSGEVLYHISQCNDGEYDELPPLADTPIRLDYSLFLEHSNSNSIIVNLNPLRMVTSEEFEEFQDFVNDVSDAHIMLESEFNGFKSSIRKGNLITSNEAGDLIASGRVSLSGTSFTVNDSANHRALSLSIEGTSTQATPSLSTPAYFVNTHIYDVRSRKSGKNLFDMKAYPLKVKGETYGGLVYSPDSVRAVIASGATRPLIGFIIPTEVGGVYTISFDPVANTDYEYTELDKPLTEIPADIRGTFTGGSTSYTATKPYLLVYACPEAISPDRIGNMYGFNRAQVEKNSTRTSYVAFEGKTLVLPSVIELNSVGNYKDTIEWDGAKWWKVQRICEVLMDGTVNKFSSASSSTSSSSMDIACVKNDLIMTDCLTSTPVVTSHGNKGSSSSPFYAYYYTGNYGISAHFSYSSFGITSSESMASKVSKVNNWLTSQNSAGNPVKIRYVLNTPIVTEITPAEVLEMFEGTTFINVTSQNNTPNLKLDYALNTTDNTTMYILKSLARKSEIQTANTFAVATL